MTLAEGFGIGAVIHCMIVYTGQISRFCHLEGKRAWVVFYYSNWVAIAIGLVGPDLFPEVKAWIFVAVASAWLVFSLACFLTTPKRVMFLPFKEEHAGPTEL